MNDQQYARTGSSSESQALEWKSSWRDEHLKWICGFANAHGGVLIVGKDDRGNIVGVADPLRLMEEIPNKVRSVLGIVVDVNLRSEADGEYLEIVVNPYPNPISYKGEYHYRSGSTKQVLRGSPLNQFLLSKYGRNWDDAPIPGVSLSDLDSRVLDEFRRRGVASGRIPPSLQDSSYDELIESLHLREGQYLRRSAVLLFHPDPTKFFTGAFVKVGYFTSETDLKYQDVIEGDLFSQVDRIEDLLRTKYSAAKISYHGFYRHETLPVPYEALREAVLNAILHRDYSVSAPIQIRVYDDSISFWNAGGLASDWTVAKLLGAHSSLPRNPGIANAFFRGGFVEAWGRGIGAIVNACRSAKTVKPQWTVEPSEVRLDFDFSTTGKKVLSRGGNSEDAAPRNASHETKRSSQQKAPSKRHRSGALKEGVIRLLKNGPMSKVEVSRGIGQKRVSGQLNKVMRRLVKEGSIAYTIPQKPQSRLQKYQLTDAGRVLLTSLLVGKDD